MAYGISGWAFYSDPTSADSDGDGLLDGKVIMNGSDIIAPTDPDPLNYRGYVLCIERWW